jgi:hypothetical protein
MEGILQRFIHKFGQNSTKQCGDHVVVSPLFDLLYSSARDKSACKTDGQIRIDYAESIDPVTPYDWGENKIDVELLYAVHCTIGIPT